MASQFTSQFDLLQNMHSVNPLPSLIHALLAAAAVVTAHPVTFYGDIGVGLPTNALPMTDTPMTNAATNHRSMLNQTMTATEADFHQYFWDWKAQDQMHERPPARKDDCKALALRMQNLEGEWPASSKPVDIGSYNLLAHALVGNGDIALLVGQATTHFGDDEHLEVFGSMKCHAPKQPEVKNLAAFWEIRNSGS
ncbi:uncharacterized protein PG986_006365 [Apiospora aurea]|uniref:Uncharacterized protein n=1 Tax=Apiospora aurea TaxID=335848 RepID=A0ABR1QK84_9PEZI